MSDRGHFASKLGVIAATAGSAVGLGNIWRFPSETMNNGGAIFIFIYILCVLFFGLPLVLAEFIIGRHGKANLVKTYQKVSVPKKPFFLFGYYSLVTTFMILGFYMLVAGWVFDYFYLACKGDLLNEVCLFSEITSNGERQMFWTIIPLLITSVIVGFGIKKGIELTSKIMLPILFVLLAGLSIYATCLPNAVDGLIFLFKPDFNAVSSSVFISALGQAFFSLSIGIGCLTTYASYFKKEVSLQRSGLQMSILDTSVAVFAAVLIASTAFAVSPDVETLSSIKQGGPGLIFKTLPMLFSALPFGQIWSIVFFLLLILATITSTISLYEILVAYIHEQLKIKRKLAVSLVSILVLGVNCFVINSICDSESVFVFFGKSLFDWLDILTAKWLMPLGGLFISLFIGWYFDKREIMVQLGIIEHKSLTFFKYYLFLVRYIAPVGIFIIFIAALIV